MTPQPDPVAKWMTSQGLVWYDRQQLWLDDTDEVRWRDSVSHESAAYFYQQVLEARIDTAQFAQNLIWDALAVDTDTRKISRFGAAADDVLQRFVEELQSQQQQSNEGRKI